MVMLVAGAAALIAAGFAFRAFRGSKRSGAKESAATQSKPESARSEDRKEAPVPLTIGEKLEQEKLGTVKMTENKYCLHPEFLIELLNFIGCEVHERNVVEAQALTAERRQYYKDENWDAYE